MRRLSPPKFLQVALATIVLCVSTSGRLFAANDVTKAVELFRGGNYEDCAAMCAVAIEAGEYSELWRLLKLESELIVGRYEAARDTLHAALERFPYSIRLRWQGAVVYRYMSEIEVADKLLEQIDGLVSGASWRYSDPNSRIVLGEYYLSRGEDAKLVLNATINALKKQNPEFADAYLAAGRIALIKHDFALAVEELEKGAKRDATNPDIFFALAEAYESTDDEKANLNLTKALQLNPRHTNSLLYVVDKHIDAERFAEAEKVLEEIATVNPLEPRMWAYRAVLAHLQKRSTDEAVCHETALSWWHTNPEVDHLIGRKLSQKYRFQEAAAYQRRSLAFKSDYHPAMLQLSQDLLRLGEEEEGWQLASAAADMDRYSVMAHNLTTLRNHLKSFRTLEQDGFVVRMDEVEAALYGEEVLSLLAEARKTLCAKFEVTLEKPTLVEIFPEQQDFAIRTFGLPGGEGFLGVCFGNVITANSPASQGNRPSNWQAVLWHEFCHVVTLNKTQNKMPRWLSEGISVYEEGQRNRAWGQPISPQYREWLLGDELTPLSQLSAAFLHARSPAHVQFAYFESALAVQFIVDKSGPTTLNRVLDDLAVGMPINESLARYFGSLDVLDNEFREFARKVANDYSADLEWDQADPSITESPEQFREWVASKSDNYWALTARAKMLVEGGQWADAETVLLELTKRIPNDASPSSAWPMLATVYRELGKTEKEREALEVWAERSSDAVPTYMRLIELAVKRGDLQAVRLHAERLLAVNPLIEIPHRRLAEACESLDDDSAAIRAWRRVVAMAPLDLSDVHFRLASLFKKSNHTVETRRHLLSALELTPRHRPALAMLLELSTAANVAPRTIDRPSGDVPKESKP